MTLLVAVGFLAVAILLTPSRVEPYLPAKASHLTPLIFQGVTLLRAVSFAGAVLALLSRAIIRKWPLLPSNQPQPEGTAPRAAVVAIIIVALCVRIPNAGESLWWDELNSLVRVVGRGWGTILAFSADGNNHVANSALMWLASRVGMQEWILRLPSLIIGATAPAMIYLVMRRIGFPQIALSVGVLWALHFRAVSFSNEARGYTGAVAFGALASMAFVGLLKHGGARWALYYVTAATTAAAFVITSAFAIPAHFLVACGLLIREGRAGDSDQARRALHGMLVCAWAMVLTLTLSAPTLPQLLDYARHRAAAAHVPTSLELYADTLVYVAGVEHLPLAAFLLLASLLGFWYARQHWFVWMCIAGPLVIQGAFVELADALVSPRLYISMLFPLVVGLALLIERTRTSAHQMTRVARFVIPLLMIGDSVPLFTRYYTVGSPDLRELAARISSSEVFLAHDQGDMNTYYFTQSESNTDAAEVLRILPTLQPSPRFVLSGRDCRRPARELETLGYHPRLTLADWTMAEHAETQRRPCFTLFEAGR